MAKHKYVCVDIESDGPAPGMFSMIQLGAVLVESIDGIMCISDTFECKLAPISAQYQVEALRASGSTREGTVKYPAASEGMRQFDYWLSQHQGDSTTRLQFVSDNAGFDWQFVNYYMWKYLNENRFGHSSFSLTSFYKGYAHDMRASFKHLRRTRHTHDALDDARGNAEALIDLLGNIEGGI
jgi:DNA polymerase III alpha subunit (gram-positive type)